MDNASTKSTEKAVRGILWTYASYYSGKLLIFISTIILARLLTQEDFGVAGYALVVISSLDAMNDMGVGPALIYHRKDQDAVDTAFWLGIGVSFTLFLATFFGAPLIGEFFNDPRAVPVTRALSFTFPLSALGHIHDVLLRKELSFGKKFIPDTVKAFGKGLITVVLALFGMGSWSLIFGQLAGEVLAVIALWYVMPWRPSFNFVKNMAKTLLGYGVNIVAVNTMSILLNNASYLLVGRYMGAAALGLYTLAYRIPEILIIQFCSLISRVIFPYYANMQDDSDGLKRGYIASTQYIMLVTMPLGVGMALVARPLIDIVFGEKWVDAAPIMQAVAIFAVMSALPYNAGDVYKARGRPDILTWLTVLEGLLLVPALYFTMITFNSIVIVGWVHAAVVFVISMVDIVIACRMLSLPYSEILKAFSPSLTASTLMGLAVFGLLSQISAASNLIQLVLGVSLGGMVYMASIWLFHRSIFLEGIRVIQKSLAGRNARPATN